MPIIIDGYNLIFTCGLEGKTRTPQSLEKARARLISAVASRTNEKDRSNTTIVFDAKRLPIKETSADFRTHQMRVLYAVDHEDADTLIEELIAKHSTPKKLIVVSSDHRLQTAATRRKATAVDSDVWYEQLLATREHRCDQKQTQIDDTFSNGALESIDWAKEFGSVEVDESDEDESDPFPNLADSSLNPFPPGYGEDLLD
jgi:predicted RNA-binding protein with PIN domain